MRPLDRFLRARDLLVSLRTDHEAAARQFAWPELDRFNWVVDYFDVYAAGNARPALVIVDDAGAVASSVSFAELAERSRRVTRFLARLGVARGDRVLVMLSNVAPLWETLLGAARLGAIVIPATTQLTTADVADRLERGAVRCAVVEVIDAVRKAWRLTVRDGYGQTETTALIGNCPGDEIVPGSMGQPLPGYRVTLLDAAGAERDDGEIAVALSPRPTGLMTRYVGDPEKLGAVTAGGFYRTGDEAVRDAAGRFTFVGRGDDVFKSSDYRISPFELESVLVEHPAVAEAAVVPSPDPVRTAVPKAFIALAPGHEPSRALGLAILGFVRERLAPYKRVRRLEFATLPKTISGKIRRVELRRLESDRQAKGERGEHELSWDDER